MTQPPTIERESAVRLLRTSGLHATADHIEATLRKRCAVCRRVFEAVRSDAKTCSPKCRKSLSRRPKQFQIPDDTLRTVRPHLHTVKVRPSFAKRKTITVRVQQPYATAIIDPDWPYTVAPGVDDFAKANGTGKLSGFTRNRDKARNIYKQRRPLSIAELQRVPVGDLVGGYVLLWVVGPFLINGAAIEVMRAWGFQPCSIITWAKWNPEKNRGYGGVGYWFLGNAEFCIVGKRPGWPSIRTCKSSLIVKPKMEHSRKPDDVHEICEQCFPGPYLEIFGRRKRKGWTVLGNETR